MYVCTYVRVYVCMNVCLYVYVCMYVCMYVCECAHTCMFLHVHANTDYNSLKQAPKPLWHTIKPCRSEQKP